MSLNIALVGALVGALAIGQGDSIKAPTSSSSNLSHPASSEVTTLTNSIVSQTLASSLTTSSFSANTPRTTAALAVRSPKSQSVPVAPTSPTATKRVVEAWGVEISNALLCNVVDNMDCMPGSLTITDSHTVFATWYGGNSSGRCNIDMKETGIWFSCYENGSWAKPQLLHKETNNKCWNPVIFNAGKDHMALFFKIGPDPRQWVPVLKHSYDAGTTWTDIEVLPAGIFGPSKNAPFIADQQWICPSSFSRGEPNQAWKSTACWLDVTTDQGKTWKKLGPLTHPSLPFSITEPTFFKNTEGNFKIFCRNRANKIGEKGFICTATFLNASQTFSIVTSTDIPNPDSGIDCVKLQDGRVLLVYNDSFTNRYPLVVALSDDDGVTWKDKIILENGPGEYSQPSIVQNKNGDIHIIYAYQPEGVIRKNIKHICLQLKGA